MRYLAIALALLASCSKSTPELTGPRIAQVIVDESQLIGGLEAAGRVGDFLLDNGSVRLVIQQPGSSTGWGIYGGSIVDLDRTGPGGEDRLQEMFFQCNLRGFAPSTAEIVNDGRDGKPAVMRMKGIDRGIPLIDAIIPSAPAGLEITIDLVLAAGKDTLEISYDVNDVQREELRDVFCGVVLLHGDEYDFFTPGKGIGVEGGELDWVASASPTVRSSYVLYRAEGQLSVIAAFDEVVPISLPSQGVLPGGRFRDKMYLSIGAGDVETALIEMRKTRGDTEERAAITVPFDAPEARLALVTVTVRDPTRQEGGDHETQAKVDLATKSATMLVGRGRVADIRIEGRVVATRELAGRVEPVTFEREGTLIVKSFETDKTGATIGPTAARLFILGGDLGNRTRYVKPEDSIVLNAGNYRVIVAKGPEHELFEQRVEVPAMGTVTLEAKLAHVVDTTGWVTVDTHVHSTKSVDSDAPLEERALGAVGEGLDILLSTDHDIVIDYAPTVERLGLSHLVKTERGTEISPLYGHFNAWPLPAGKYWEIEWFKYQGDAFERMLDPHEIAALARSKGASIVQVNHPRDSKGAFDYIQLDPETMMSTKPYPDPDCVEVMNGKRDGSYVKQLADVVGAWKHDKRVTAVAVSDAHARGSAIGYGRTAIKSASDDPRTIDLPAVWAALKQGKAIAMIGAFVTIEARVGSARAGIGEVLTSSRAPVQLDVVVQAPSWMNVERVQLFRDGAIVDGVTLGEAERDPANPVVRFRGTFTSTPAEDAFYFVEVRGIGDNEPVIGAPVHTITNPVFVDVAGDGFAWGR